MKKTDFAVFLNKYFTDYLVNTRGSTEKTIDSYRYAFIFLLEYYSNVLKIPAEKIYLADLTYENISGFYKWLQEYMHNGISTRNQRQAAINSFIRFMIYERPEYITEFQRILGIPKKKAPQKEISYLKADGIKLLMDQVSTNDVKGLRDYVILMLMYTTGIRVTELINIKVKNLSLSSPCTLLVYGKGQKSRFVPLNSKIVPIIKKYLNAMHYDDPARSDDWLFVNHMGNPFTRQGICYLVRKYAKKAQAIDASLIPTDMSPHKIRHSAAMGLVSSGVDLIYIRDLLGHVSVKTTEVYYGKQVFMVRQSSMYAQLLIFL